MSYCQLLNNDPGRAHFVGPPTVFLSHAWKYSFEDVMAAIQRFVAWQPEGSPEVFFWFDCFSLDQHACVQFPQEWWSGTFRTAIQMIGHTVMVITPWGGMPPCSLTRAWCLWEVYCTIDTNTPLTVVLPPDAQAEFDAALEANGAPHIFNALDLHFENFEAPGNGAEDDLAMIMAAAAAVEGGIPRMNALITAHMFLALQYRPAARPEAPPEAPPEGGLLGISLEGLRAFEESHPGSGDQLLSTVVRSVHADVVPAGWQVEHTVLDAAHPLTSMTFRDQATGIAQTASPPFTMSYCELLQADLARAQWIGAATHHLTASWQSQFRTVLDAVEEFVATEATPVFLWFDIFSLDQLNLRLYEWETVTASCRHRLIYASPWTCEGVTGRAWLVLELCQTIKMGGQITVCLPPEERAHFDQTLEEGGTAAIFDMLSEAIDMRGMQAGSLADQERIRATIEEFGGRQHLEAALIGHLLLALFQHRAA